MKILDDVLSIFALLLLIIILWAVLPLLGKMVAVASAVHHALGA